jgi:hypothetical protein
MLHALDFEYSGLGNPVSEAIDLALKADVPTESQVHSFLADRNAVHAREEAHAGIFAFALPDGERMTSKERLKRMKEPLELYQSRLRVLYRLWLLCEQLGFQPNGEMRNQFLGISYPVVGYPQLGEDSFVPSPTGVRRRLYERRPFDWDFRELTDNAVALLGYGAGLKPRKDSEDFSLPSYLDVDVQFDHALNLYRLYPTLRAAEEARGFTEELLQAEARAKADPNDSGYSEMFKKLIDHWFDFDYHLSMPSKAPMSGIVSLASLRTWEILRHWRGELSTEAMPEDLRTLAKHDHTPLYRLADDMIKKLKKLRGEIEKREKEAKSSFKTPALPDASRRKDIRLPRLARCLVLKRRYGLSSEEALDKACESLNIENKTTYKDFTRNLSPFWKSVLSATRP